MLTVRRGARDRLSVVDVRLPPLEAIQTKGGDRATTSRCLARRRAQKQYSALTILKQSIFSTLLNSRYLVHC